MLCSPAMEGILDLFLHLDEHLNVLAGTLGEAEIIYYCVDEYTAFRGVDSGALAAIERSLIHRADLVIVSAEKLLHSKRSPTAPTLLVRHGVDHEHFAAALRAETEVPEEIARLPKPVIGYFGLIAEDWVDVPLLVKVARSFPTGSLVLLGKSTMDVAELAREPNVHLLGRKPYSTQSATAISAEVRVSTTYSVTQAPLIARDRGTRSSASTSRSATPAP